MRTGPLAVLLACGPLLLGHAWGDGKVLPEAAYLAEGAVKIPDQRALIQFDNGVERLIVETSFVGPGTNFAWIVPLPAVPKIEAVSPDLFRELAALLAPKLVPRVPRYFVLFLLAGVWVRLARQSLANERYWVSDLPWCIGAALLTGLGMLSVWWGISTLVFLVVVRVAPSKEGLALVTLGFGGVMLLVGGLAGRGELLGLVNTLGDSDDGARWEAQVTVHQRLQVGVYDAVVVSAKDADPLQRWLSSNGFAVPARLAPALAEHVREGWVFVAAKVRRQEHSLDISTPHPLAFTFTTEKAVYPLRLTGLDNDACRIELYVLGPGRAKAKHFKVESRWQTQFAGVSNLLDRATRVLKVDSPDLSSWVNGAPVLTKLSGTLDSDDMKSDARLDWGRFRFKQAAFYSHSAALMAALNAGVGVAVLGWLGILSCAGGWNVSPSGQRKWAWRVVPAALAMAALVYFLLPKAEMHMAPRGVAAAESAAISG